MQVVWDIIIASGEIVVLIFAFFGLVLSLLLIFARDFVHVASRVLNRNINVDEKIFSLNRLIQTNRLAYHYHRFFSIGFILGSIFFLAFLYTRLDHVRFTNIIYDIVFNSLVLLGKVAGFAGILLGGLLLAFPRKVQQWEEALSLWFDTQPLVDRLNRSHDVVDILFFRYPRFVGTLGAVSSLFLIVLSLISIFR